MAYATGADLASWLRIDADDAELAMATEAASRAIDRATGRTFGTTEPETWTYQAEYARGQTLVNINDLMTIDDLVIEVDGIVVHDYKLCPPNAAQKGRPWTHLALPSAVHGWVSITARWGWALPDAVKLACLIQAARFYERRGSAAGPLNVKQVDDVRYGWSVGHAQDLDPDVLASIAAYRRLWVAA
jgi:hypothetical protein